MSTTKQGNKHIVENYTDSSNPIVIEGGDLKESVFITKCKKVVVQVKGKISSIVLDGCQDVGVCFDTLVATCEVVNCKHCQVQVTGTVPTVQVEKCDLITLYLSKEAKGLEIVTSMSTGFNIMTPGATEEDDMKEYFVPEQYVSKFESGKLVTKVLENTY
eukprot:GCRY01000218.1.p1 GENE.GCRY01000218.1~~GCRY01000218.1.p1  ORF type:complete len:160 (-),score=38.15 GCRY01000218.1:54-533(-)